MKTIALEQTAGPADVHTAEVSEFQLSANGKKLLIVKRADGPAAMPELQIMDAAAKPPASPAELARTAVRLADWQLKQSPSDEWRQIFGDAWRMHRDYFYDPSMHGVDWLAMRAKFEPLLARVTDRAELADLMGQLVAEVNALHSQVAPGDTRSGAENVAVGGLGAVFAATPSGLQVRKIYQTDTELPSERGPLAQLGVELLVGDTVAAINNQSTVGVDDAGELLRGQVGKQVLLGVQRGTSTFSRIVVPVSAARERELRLTDWEISRRQAVEAASANKYGYLHLRAMGEGDVGTFAREFYPVYDRDGLIIDVRGNGGGSVDSILIEKLMRRAWMFWQAREGGGYWNMQHAFRGHIVVITDEDTYSNGETFAEGFKRLGLGTVIGRRTAGAGVWLTDRNRQVDGGITRAAEFATYSLDDTWLIEGVGSKPDIGVDNPPRATFDGQDAQLDAAIAHLRKQLAAKPVPQVKQPPYRKL